MPSFFDKLKGWLNHIVELGLMLIALGIVLQILFGSKVGFITGDVISNMTGMITQLGNGGVAGLVAIGVIMWLFSKKQTG